MNLLADLEGFVTDHRSHGTLTGDATPPTWKWLPAHRGVSVIPSARV